MSDFCDKLDKWDDMTREEKEDFLTDIVNEYLDFYGYEPVDITFDDESDYDGDGIPDNYGSWNEDHVNFDDSSVDTENADTMIGTGVHEATHQIQNEEFTDPYWDEAYEKNPDVNDMFERDADNSASAWLDKLKDDCKKPPPESPPKKDVPEPDENGGDGGSGSIPEFKVDPSKIPTPENVTGTNVA